MKLPFDSSYPEGNFGRNQLLDGSISLSPLYSIFENDLHVSISTILHQTFAWLRSNQAKFATFRVSIYILYLTRKINSPVGQGASKINQIPVICFRFASEFITLTLAYKLNSLVRVPRRVCQFHCQRNYCNFGLLLNLFEFRFRRPDFRKFSVPTVIAAYAEFTS